MISIVFGIICLLIFGYAVLPFPGGLGFTTEFLYVLKGAIPLLILILGILCLLVGMADMIDKQHAKKEVKLQEEFEKSRAKNNSNTEQPT